MNTFTWIEAKTPEQVVAELQSQRGGPAVVKAGGKYYVATKEVKVTLGGCGG